MPTPLQSARDLLQAEASALAELATRLDGAFTKTVDLIAAHAGKVVLCGVGKSGLIGQKVAATLCSTGTPAIFLHAADAVHGDLGILQAGDPVVLISRSGTTAELVRLIPVLRSFKSPIIAIVGNTQSPLATQADVVLDIGARPEADPLGLVPTTSALLTLESLGTTDLSERSAMEKLPQRLVNVRVADKGAALAAVEEPAAAEGTALEGRGRVLVRASGPAGWFAFRATMPAGVANGPLRRRHPIRRERMILVTGGAGFIGSNFVLDWRAAHPGEGVVNLDALTYAGNRENLATLDGDAGHVFVQGDICNRALVDQLLATHRPRAVLHFAAESHVDRSIHGPGAFIKTNIEGTFTLLEAARAYWGALDGPAKSAFRFLHVSTDEVYGSLGPQDPPFAETNPYEPNSPYSASKAASDHLVRAWHHTYGLPVLTTNCSNNYGPFHFPEKLIPLMIVNALAGKPLPVYGDGLQVRDWLYVKDHCSAIRAVLAGGRLGETYNVGGWNEKPNIDIVHTVCALLDELRPSAEGSYTRLITYVKDRPGHDRRYAIDARKIERELGWRPAETFESGIRKTIQWYLDHPDWVQRVQSGAYRDWVQQQYQ